MSIAAVSDHEFDPMPDSLSPATGADNQALRDDPPPLPGVPLGILIIGALGWLLAAIAIVVMPWPMPGAQPTVFGALLRRLVVTIPDEDVLSALIRHVVDLLPFVALITIPMLLVLAAGRRQSQGAVRWLTVVAGLGVFYSLGMALYVGGACAVIGFVVVLSSGMIGNLSWIKNRVTTAAPTIESISEPVVAPNESEPETNTKVNEVETGDEHDNIHSAS